MGFKEQQEERWFDEKKVSEITGRAIQTLRNDRFHGKGFPYYRVGRSIRYKLSDILLFMEVRRIATQDQPK
jgi:hypothetical protein